MTPFEQFHDQALPIITEALEHARATDTRWPNLQLWVEVDPRRDDGRVLRVGLDDEAGIDMLTPAWLNIYPAPADKVDLEEYTGGVEPVSMDDIWPLS
jgi:hypothetical protein